MSLREGKKYVNISLYNKNNIHILNKRKNTKNTLVYEKFNSKNRSKKQSQKNIIIKELNTINKYKFLFQRSFMKEEKN